MSLLLEVLILIPELDQAYSTGLRHAFQTVHAPLRHELAFG